ncbi:MAG TPA: adenosylmethionine--8-amino-7-oxononanoate transaminase, partial [Polyangiaceae bacterium]|nr:adenosylmethionine--8-amino-7-oxononanoate transaminase [Polyangiaceae bacterium]
GAPGAAERRRALVEADKRHVWHPYTAADLYERHVDPLVIASARGAWLEDVDGRRYLDGNSSWWVGALGHNHPRLVRALCEQAEALCHCALAGVTHEPAARLAEELVAVAPPGLRRVFYSDNGSTAIEAAVKIVAQYWAQQGRPARKRFLALGGAFHGETLAAASLGGVELFRGAVSGLAFDCLRVDPAGGGDAYARAFDALGDLVARHAHELAAVVVEPVLQGTAGMRAYPPAFLRHLRERCDAHDVFLVFDEVFTGYGRTGPMWAADHAGVAPDLLCVGKGFTGGVLPMAATLATERVYDGFRGARDRAFFHGHSFCGNPLGAAVAREVLRVYRDERVLEGVPERAARIARAFAELGGLPGASGPRALGMVGAIDLMAPGAGGGYLAEAGWRVYDEARRRGAYLRPLGNTIYITPSLNIPDSDLDELLGIVEESVRAA